jgi:hypothetical protein
MREELLRDIVALSIAISTLKTIKIDTDAYSHTIKRLIELKERKYKRLIDLNSNTKVRDK